MLGFYSKASCVVASLGSPAHGHTAHEANIHTRTNETLDRLYIMLDLKGLNIMGADAWSYTVGEPPPPPLDLLFRSEDMDAREAAAIKQVFTEDGGVIMDVARLDVVQFVDVVSSLLDTFGIGEVQTNLANGGSKTTTAALIPHLSLFRHVAALQILCLASRSACTLPPGLSAISWFYGQGARENQVCAKGSNLELQPKITGVFKLAKTEIDSLIAVARSASMRQVDVVAVRTDLPTVSAQVWGDLAQLYIKNCGIYLLYRSASAAQLLSDDLTSRCPHWQAWAHSEVLDEQKLKEFGDSATR